jgi:2-oxoglutarate dehydrogenase E1 component
LGDLAAGRWQPVLDDPEPGAGRERAETLLFCSGKMALDLLESPQRAERKNVPVARLEQVAPFPAEEVQALLDAYPRLRRLVWVQEEPENMGAWTWLQPQLAARCTEGVTLHVVARPASSSPAEGSASRHAATQQTLVASAFALSAAVGPARKSTRRR